MLEKYLGENKINSLEDVEVLISVFLKECKDYENLKSLKNATEQEYWENKLEETKHFGNELIDLIFYTINLCKFECENFANSEEIVANYSKDEIASEIERRTLEIEMLTKKQEKLLSQMEKLDKFQFDCKKTDFGAGREM